MASQKTLMLGEAIPSDPRQALDTVSAVLSKIESFFAVKDVLGAEKARSVVFPRLAAYWEDKPFCERLGTAAAELRFIREKLLKEVI